MAANNSVVVIGRVGNSAAEDMRTTRDGKSVVEVRLAVTRPGGKDSMGNPITDWITCQFWEQRAERVAEWIQKGDLISVTGSIRIDSWEKEGEKRQKMYVAADNFQQLTSKADREKSGGAQAPTRQKQSQPARAAAPPKPQDDFLDEFALDDDELPPF